MSGCLPAGFYDDRRSASSQCWCDRAIPVPLQYLRPGRAHWSPLWRAAVGSDLEAEQSRIFPHQLVDAIGSDCLLPITQALAERGEKCACYSAAMAGFLEVVVDQIPRHAVERDVTRLFAVAGQFGCGLPRRSCL